MLDHYIGRVRDVLAALGVAALMVLFALQQSGFFAWAAERFPSNPVLQLIGG